MKYFSFNIELIWYISVNGNSFWRLTFWNQTELIKSFIICYSTSKWLDTLLSTATHFEDSHFETIDWINKIFYYQNLLSFTIQHRIHLIRFYQRQLILKTRILKLNWINKNLLLFVIQQRIDLIHFYQRQLILKPDWMNKTLLDLKMPTGVRKRVHSPTCN